jgi:Ca2+-binding EF-hand superfamily protein
MPDTITEDEMVVYKELFDLFDKNNDGEISFVEYKSAVSIFNENVSAEYIEDSFNEYAIYDNINFSNFTRAMVSSKEKEYMVDEDLRSAFEVFDVDKDGGVSVHDYYAVMSRIDSSLTIEITEETFRELGLGLEDKIDYELFKRVISE